MVCVPRSRLVLRRLVALAAFCLVAAGPASLAAADRAVAGGDPAVSLDAAPVRDGAADRRKSAPSDEAKKEADGSDSKKDDKDQPKEPPFDKAIKGTRQVEGLFSLYVKDEEAKILLEIAPAQLDVPFLLNPTLVSGIGQAFLYPADMLHEYVVSFHRIGKTVQLIHRNALFRADEKSSLRRAASLAAPDAVVGQSKIESQPHPDRKSVLVDFSSFFLGDLEGLGLALKEAFEVPYQLDKDGSSVASLKGFPGNVDFETVLHFKTGEVKKAPVYAADPRSLLVRFHYSLARLPETGYRPRLGDDRVGHFLALSADYTDDRAEQPTVRYVSRWQLDKKDPSAGVSEPKQPIVFYLENSVPVEYRDAVRRGILGWNKAFEAIGFKDAVQVRPQPDDPDWDAADIRYATIRWIVAPNAGFAQGPSRIDPYTGQIFDADIRFSADMIRNVRNDFDEVVAPVAAAATAGSASTDQLLRTLSGWTSMLGPFAIEDLLRRTDPALAAASGSSGVRSGARPSAALGCDFARGLSQQAALGWSLMEARGLLDPAAKEKFVDDFIEHVTLHEVGHTLGLRHNFKASRIHPFDRLQDKALTAREGLTGSVMDYTPVNLGPDAAHQGEYWQTTIGPYDYWAIEYAYKPIAAASMEEERPALDAIASKVADPLLAYGTDEDTFSGTARGIDPTSNMWDLGGDILAYYRGRAGIAREILARMEDRFGRPGTRYQKLRLVFMQAIGEMVPAAANVPKYVGGIRHNRDHIGDPDGRVPYEPVPAAQQREALAFLNREIFGPGALQVPPALLNKLAIERFEDIEGNYWTVERNDLPIHALVLAIQSIPMDRLFHPIALGRLNDLEARYTRPDETFTMAEMFTSVRRAVWSEIEGRAKVTSFRRNLQRKHLTTLINLVVQLDTPSPEDARTLARADLLAIRRGIDAALGQGSGRLDAVTRAHLDETRARITAALDAGLQRRLAPGAKQG